MPRSHEGLIRLLRREGISDHVVEAFRRVRREDFVPAEHRGNAYADRPVPLPQRQTTTQPSLIARMIEAARPSETDRALELGTGFGFQTAVLAQLVDHVYSMERVAALADVAKKNLARAGITNASVFVGDGWRGMPQAAPFDLIVVSAAAIEVPRALEEQLGEGGRLVIPVKAPTSDDVLLFEKRDGDVRRISLLTPARFVPLVPGEET
jgi:protein-L-isoaspartate(D-aspartate) O-methyltransferase